MDHSTRRRGGPAALVLVLCAILVVGIVGPARAVVLLPQARLLLPLPGEQSFSVQLHTHGPLSEGSGSMEWHHSFARDLGVDAIWWTDHDWRVVASNHTVRFDFENTTYIASEDLFQEPDEASPGDFRLLERYTFLPGDYRKAVVDTLAYEGTHSLLLALQDATGTPLPKTLDVRQTGSRKQNMYSLAHRPRIRFALFPEILDPATDRFVLNLTLSERQGSRHRLRYVVGSMTDEPAYSIPLSYVLGQWNTYEVDPLADAVAIWTAGGEDSLRAADNSLFEIRLQLRTQSGGGPQVFFDDLQYEPDPAADGDAMLAWTQAEGDYLESLEPGTEHFVGSEISRYRAQPHMNSYTPGPFLVDYSGTGYADSLYYAVDQIHAVGGIVSYNHPWGTGVYGDLSESQESKEQRIEWMTGVLVGNRMYEADLLEVGYRWRHGIQVDGHLSLWDALLATETFVTGIGTTDSHGTIPFHGWAPWAPSGAFENNFVTWVWSPQLTEIDLIEALDSGRAWFGDPWIWQGGLDLMTTDGFPMGRAIVTDAPSHDLQVEITNFPADTDVFLRQVEIVGGTTSPTPLNVLREELLVGTVTGGTFEAQVTVDTTVPSFVRVEMRSPTEAFVYSNPVHFLRSVPGAGIEAGRIGIRFDDVRVLEAEGLLLRDASLGLVPAELTLQLDETTPGLGSLVMDPGSRGVPSAVTGAANWSWDGSRVHIDGFSGAGSTVLVQWDVGVGVPGPESTIRDVQLSAGRPNPFGRGLVTELALPRRANVFLEVLDVQGRRVRLLLDEPREAGVHRVEWDGRDAYGRSVANGVYFLRATALGKALSTKAVKLQ